MSASRRPAGPRPIGGRTVVAMLAVAMLAVALLVAACGSASSEPASSDSAGPGTAEDAVSPAAPVTPATPGAADPTPESPIDADADVVIEVDVDAEDGTGIGDDPGPAGPPGPDAPMPATPSELATALEQAEAAIRNPDLGDAAAAGWGRYQQRLYLRLSANPDWVDEAIALEDPALARAARLNWTARTNLDALVASHGPEPDVPAWRVVAPRPADELLGYYRDGEASTSIEWPYLAAINLIETRMGRIEGVSSAGAVGPMQFLTTTWAECCDGDPTDPADAIAGAARYLTIRGGPDDMAKAIWGYNNSDHYVAAVSAYAEVMRDDELAYRGYHAWEIFFRSTEGLLHLPVGYEELEAIPAAAWLVEHPDRLIAG